MICTIVHFFWCISWSSSWSCEMHEGSWWFCPRVRWWIRSVRIHCSTFTLKTSIWHACFQISVSTPAMIWTALLLRKAKNLFKISWRFLLRAEHLFLLWASGCSCFLILSAERESLSVSHASLTALLIYCQQKAQRCTGGRWRCKLLTAVFVCAFVWLMCVSHLNKALLLLHP